MDDKIRYSAKHATKVRERIAMVCSEVSDIKGLLKGIADIIIDHFSDAFAIDLVEDDGTVRRYITSHIDHETQVKIEELRDRYPLPSTAAYGYPRVIKTGKSQFIPGVSPRIVPRLFADRDGKNESGEFPMVRSFICVPLIAYGRTLGALTVTRSDRTNPFTSGDLLLIEDLAPVMAKCLDDRFV
jgi:GAF domain-containing protein